MSLTPEQIAVRRSRIGASEVGAILGIDPYKSELDVFTEKTLPPDGKPKAHQQWGHYVEEPIVAFVADDRGYRIVAPPDGGKRWPSLPHPTLPLVATPDALARERDGATKLAIQAKNDQGHGQLEWGDPGTDDAPLVYVAQAVVEIGVLHAAGYDVVRDELAVVRRGAPPVVYPIKFDPELFHSVAEVCARWVRDHLDTGKPPDGTPGEMAEYVRRRWSRHDERMLQPTHELVDLVQRVALLKRQKKTAEAELTTAENELKAAIGEAAGIAGLCTWKLQNGSTYQVTKSPSRVLRLIGAKEE